MAGELEARRFLGLLVQPNQGALALVEDAVSKNKVEVSGGRLMGETLMTQA